MKSGDAVVIDAVLVGEARPLGSSGKASAIAKQPVVGPLRVEWLGLAGDQQADRSVHGGPDKAIHHYPRDHYPGWIGSLGSSPTLDRAGAFGENISTMGWTEDDVSLGDRFRLGTALVEIAQGRQPCWKQGAHLDNPSVVAAMVTTGRTGWYYRVIEEGTVTAGDPLVLVERPFPTWPVSRAFALLIGGHHKGEQAALGELVDLAILADGWRKRAGRLAG